MLIQNRYETFESLRATYPAILYEQCKIAEDDNGLVLSFVFTLNEELRFAPSLRIPRPSTGWHVPLDHAVVKRTAFLIGLIELVSYWKATCAPEIRIHGSLDSWEQGWWARLIRHGMAEFLFRNGIPLDYPNLVTFRPDATDPSVSARVNDLGGNLVPVGGGKDSAVVLRLLDGERSRCSLLLLNPTPAATAVARTAGYGSDEVVIVSRTLDPLLLDLNARGFLNGHTPFSALLAFVSVLVATLWGREYVVLANESSANESTVAGSDVNHQYSKSIAFEDDFREYIARCVTPDVQYFSLLRALNEIQIGERFARLAGPLANVFCSCNVKGRAGIWCGACEKCLFAYLILAPFVPSDLLPRVFGSDLLERVELLPGLERLLGVTDAKPFDCVGTIAEVRTLVNHLGTVGGLPKRLLEAARRKHASLLSHAMPLGDFLIEYNGRNNVPPSFAQLVSGRPLDSGHDNS
jgi:hypothetical protein